MKAPTLTQAFWVAPALLLMLGGCSSSRYAQTGGEYDDMYFVSSDRAAVRTNQAQASATRGSYYAAESYAAERNPVPNNNTNDNYYREEAAPADEGVDYFREDFRQEARPSGGATYTTNNFYGSPAFAQPGIGWMNTGFGFYNPAFSPFFYDPFLFRPFRPGLTIGIGIGFGRPFLGPGFGFGGPFMGPGFGFYDPFWGPGFGFGSPFMGPGFGFYDPFWGPRFGGGFYGGGFYGPGFAGGGFVGDINRRPVTYGPRNNRSSVLSGRGGAPVTTRPVRTIGAGGSAEGNSRDVNRVSDARRDNATRGGNAVGERGTATGERGISPAQTRPARETNLTRQVTPRSAGQESYRPSRSTSDYQRQAAPAQRQASPTRQVAPSQRQAAPTRQAAPSRQAAPTRQTAPSRSNNNYYQRPAAPSRQSAPSRNYSSPSRQSAPSRNYSSPSRQSAPSRNFSSPSRSSSPSYSAPSRSSSPSRSAPSRSPR